MNNRLMRLIRFGAFAFDVLMLNLLFVLLELQMQRVSSTYAAEYARFLLWLNISWVGAGWVGFLYYDKYLLDFEAFCRRTMHIFFVWLTLVLLYLFFTRQYGLSRIFIGIFLTAYGTMLMVNRMVFLWVRHYLQRNAYIVRRVVVIGYNQTAKKLVDYLEEEGRYTEVVGFCEEEVNVRELSHYPILSSVGNALQVSKLHGVQEVYSTIAPENNHEIYRLIEEADQACIRFRIIPDLNAIVNRSFRVNYLNDLPILSLHNPHVDDPGNIFRKRVFDLVVSGLVIVFILSWLLPLMALLIRLESRGPVFFRQQRTGKDNKPFWCLKFRSMRVNNDANTRQASKDDDRFTKIGRFLRKSSLDEFPQFLNVFRGDMSIVGPRPHMLKHTDDYSKVIDDYMVRQFLKPGVTGWAQVNGYRGETRTLLQMQKRVEHDLWYMENWSLWLDVRIVFLTAFSIFKGDENAF